MKLVRVTLAGEVRGRTYTPNRTVKSVIILGPGFIP